jgi:hypothetical protein
LARTRGLLGALPHVPTTFTHALAVYCALRHRPIIRLITIIRSPDQHRRHAAAQEHPRRRLTPAGTPSAPCGRPRPCRLGCPAAAAAATPSAPPASRRTATDAPRPPPPCPPPAAPRAERRTQAPMGARAPRRRPQPVCARVFAGRTRRRRRCPTA